MVSTDLASILAGWKSLARLCGVFFFFIVHLDVVMSDFDDFDVTTSDPLGGSFTPTAARNDSDGEY